MDKKRLFFSIIILAAIGLVIVFLILPQVSRVKNVRSEIDNLKAELSRKTELSEKIDEMILKYNELVAKIQKIDLTIPKGPQKPELIVQIESLAKENGLILESIVFREPTQKEAVGYKILNISLTLSGNYLAFKNFLTALEQNIRLMDVQLIDFSSPERVVIPGVLPTLGGSISESRFNIQLNTYYQ